MTNLEWEILDQSYFMTDYRSMFDNVQQPVSDFNAALVKLMQDGLLRQLFYNDTIKDYSEQEPFDASRLSQAHYVISKNGLLAHTGSL